MKKHGLMILTTIILFTGTSAFASVPVEAPIKIHRFLLVAGANNGGAGRVTLRYAVSDARAFAAVLTEMGGVDERNKVFLNEPTAAEMLKGFASIEQKLNDPRYQNGRREIVVYYSGHADEEGLRLGREIMRWSDFRRQVDNLSADLKVAVVDACASGAITRIKGGVVRPAFLSDASSDMKGYAFLTSSSDSEVSQESDRLRGSFFTHALVSGLRGAADMTGSGTVTLSEAYQFAFNETLHSTSATMGGVQHPSRDMNLTGTGDVVMTDLRHANSVLILDADLGGRFFIRDERNFLVAELYKTKGRAIELGLSAGVYNIRLETSMVAPHVQLLNGERTLLTANMLRPARRERTVARGGEGVDGDTDEIDDGIYDDSDYYADDDQHIGNDAAAANIGVDVDEGNIQQHIYHNPLLDSARAAPFRFHSYFIYGYSETPSRGLQLSLALNDARAEYAGTQIAVGMNLAQKDFAGVQVSAGLNMANRLFGAQWGTMNMLTQGGDGVQVGVINILNDTLNGVQAGVLNIARGYINYAQYGVVNAMSGDVEYAQVGVINTVRDASTQIGVINTARDVRHLQLGVVNTAMDVGYVQIGTVNTAINVGRLQLGVVNVVGETERQIGVVNVAKRSEKTPIGLLNIVGNGILEATITATTAEELHFSLRTGMPRLYSVIEYGRPIGNKDVDWNDALPPQWHELWHHSLGYGLGTRFGMNGSFTVNLEYVYSQYYMVGFEMFNTDHYYPYSHNLRLGASYSPWKYIAVTGGINMVGRIEGDPNKNCPWRPFDKRAGSIYSRYTARGHRLHAWPELYVGLSVGQVRSLKD